MLRGVLHPSACDRDGFRVVVLLRPTQFTDVIGLGLGSNGVFGILLKVQADADRAVELAGAA